MDDLISRASVEDLIMETDPWWCEGMTRAIFEGIKRLPTIDHVKRGKWIKDGETYALYKCSVCNDFCTVVGYANCIPEERMYKTMKYCPNCGAKMDRSEE